MLSEISQREHVRQCQISEKDILKIIIVLEYAGRGYPTLLFKFFLWPFGNNGEEINKEL